MSDLHPVTRLLMATILVLFGVFIGYDAEPEFTYAGAIFVTVGGLWMIDTIEKLVTRRVSKWTSK